MMKVLVVLGGLWVLSHAYSVANNANRQKLSPISATKDQNCKCMNWRSCHGEINSDVICPGSYINVCCILTAHNALRRHSNNDEIKLIQVS